MNAPAAAPAPGGMDMGDIVAGAFGIYRRAPLPWLAITALSFVIVFALQWAFAGRLDLGPDPTDEQLQESLPAVFAILFGALAADLFAHVALVAAAVGALSGTPPSVGRAYATAARRYIPVLAGSFVTGLVASLLVLTMIGTPVAIFLVVSWSLLTQVVVAEGLGPLRGLGRSRAIVKGQWWRTLGITLAISLLAFLPGFFAGLITGSGPDWLAALGAALAGSIVAPFIALAQTLLYGDLRARKGERPFVAPVREAA